MTHQEARRILEASTGFDVRGRVVWLREVRWLRAVERLRAEGPAAPEAAAADGADPADRSPRRTDDAERGVPPAAPPT